MGVSFGLLLWMDEILHHLETMGNRCLLVFTGESSFQGFLGGAKWISSIHSRSPSGALLSRFSFRGGFPVSKIDETEKVGTLILTSKTGGPSLSLKSP